MSDIKSWSNSAGGNTSASPNGFPEGMAPSGVNDAARETMAAVKRWYESAEWLDFGHTPTYISAASFLVSAGQAATATYHIGRRIKALDGVNTIYGTINSSTWTASAVYIYTTNDAGANFTASLSGIAVGSISKVNTSWPDMTVSFANSASAATRAQYADSAGYANAAWDGTAARNFGYTASANTVPISDASGKIDANFIPAGATNTFDTTSTSTVTISSTISWTQGTTRQFLTTILPASGKYEVELSVYAYSASSNATTQIGIWPASASSVVTALYVHPLPIASGPVSVVDKFVYSASLTQTLALGINAGAGTNVSLGSRYIRISYRN